MIKTYEDQIREHIAFLRLNGLDVAELQVFYPGKAEYVRCLAIGETTGRGEYCYQTVGSTLNNGRFGLSTICRLPDSKRVAPFRTYGLPPSGNFINSQVNHAHFATPAVKRGDDQEGRSSEDGIRKSQYIWNLANETGRSDYLERKGVGAYGIRFLENTYGRVAVVPARDQGGSIRALEFLNPDGVKRFLTGSSWKGLFHLLKTPVNGQVIGIAESYVTAATCMELAGIPTVCAFSCHNLKSVALAMRKLYQESGLIIFADNDRHLLDGNQGLLKAQGARDTIKTSISLSLPDFGDLAPSKEASDWNDLVRLKGVEYSKRNLRKCPIFDRR
jgi:phage/plasmid primase-like uncharacterized protein